MHEFEHSTCRATYSRCTMFSDLACNRSPFAPPSPKPIWRAPRPAHKASSAHALPPRRSQRKLLPVDVNEEAWRWTRGEPGGATTEGKRAARRQRLCNDDDDDDTTTNYYDAQHADFFQHCHNYYNYTRRKWRKVAKDWRPWPSEWALSIDISLWS